MNRKLHPKQPNRPKEIMQCPEAHGASASSGATTEHDALQVLATMATSNDHHLLVERCSHRDVDDNSSNESPVDNGDVNGDVKQPPHAVGNVKSSSSGGGNDANNNSEDDESESRSSSGSSGSGSGVSAAFSKRTGLRKGKWTVSAGVIILAYIWFSPSRHLLLFFFACMLKIGC